MESKYSELRAEVERKLGFTPEVRRHFDMLSEAVFETTKEQVSSTTLRRFWGYQEATRGTSVRRFTLDILARYVGYNDYIDFVSNAHIQEEGQQPLLKITKHTNRWWLVLPVLALLGVLGVVCYMFVPHGHHYDFEQDGLYYNILPGTDNCVEVTYKSVKPSCEELDITIPQEVEFGGKTYQVTAIGDSAFAYKRNLIAIVLPPTIERIGAYAFYECDSLTHLNMPDAVVGVGEYAMCRCDLLNSVRLSSRLTEIPAYCFSACIRLQEIELPDGVKALRRDAFGDCFQLRRINLPEGLNMIERGSFWNCEKLTEITLPASLETIGDFVFWGCTSLKRVTALPLSPIRITNIFNKLSPAPKLFVHKEAVSAYAQTQYWDRLEINPLDN